MDRPIILSSADIITASGHIGYQWDLLHDCLVWFGPWQQLFGQERAAPPTNALELSKCILANDHHLIFSDVQTSFDREYRLRCDDGSLLWVHEHGTTDFENGHAIRQQGLIRLIETVTDLGPSPYNSPDRDPLTGRPNRACMLSVIEKLLKTSQQKRQQSAYLVVGIDKLAFMNEAMGTKAADQLICAVADRLNDLCPTRSLVGRVSGDIFGILLPNMAHEMESLTTRILANFHDHAISAGTTCLHLSVGVGCMPFADTQADAYELMIHAEQALNEANQTGRGQHVTYIESARRAERNRGILDICERVKQSLKNKTLKLAYQPVVEAHTSKVVFYEALSRLFNDDGSPMPAGEFIPVVEQMGLAPEFDRHVLDIAIADLEESNTLNLAINISGLTAGLPDWPGYFHEKLASRPEIAKRLIVEITETAAVVDIEKMKNLVSALRKVGCQLSLDDFGAGSTSIRHLRDLDFSIMKIDRDLLINLTTNTEQRHLVRMLIAMAHGLRLQSVAEGIEDEETAVWLRQENVDMLQGYHLGRPSFVKPWLDGSVQCVKLDHETKRSIHATDSGDSAPL
ncbi:MAG: EAL domain-containing protein [Alphaproteobacteria bacterium]|nr:EAL domain-containing protein [Alphaproteobacteria bacterium]